MTFSCQPALVHSIAFSYNACASFLFLICRCLRKKCGMSALFSTDLRLFYVLSENIISWGFCSLGYSSGIFILQHFLFKHACNMFSFQPDFNCMFKVWFAAVILICICDPSGPPYQVTLKEEMTLTQKIKSK